MTDNVIHVDFDSNGNSGYVMTDGHIDGVYSGEITAVNDNGIVYLGTKVDNGIDKVTEATMDEINEFCLMWLLIFNPEVIVE